MEQKEKNLIINKNNSNNNELSERQNSQKMIKVLSIWDLAILKSFALFNYFHFHYGKLKLWEIIYADDTDFISTSPETLANIEPIPKTVLESWNLAMNTDKTDWTTLKRVKEKKNETWRNTKKLGTLLGDREEMQRRKQLSSAVSTDFGASGAVNATKSK